MGSGTEGEARVGGKGEGKEESDRSRGRRAGVWRGYVQEGVIMKAKTERVEVANRKPTRGCAREIGEEEVQVWYVRVYGAREGGRRSKWQVDAREGGKGRN
ncbi:hypothetical protein B0H16DRAFT_1481523 [Mycena metata]|uniref:Uncharacterized protein n=1 Tax=Mycena metata TaxID=1033252 RepID=A0AAD7MA84_9AGAR|nr:hypothetical protein B0H16DRAFT_1481523 [Mycena metata]